MKTASEIIQTIGIHPYKVKNIYMFGSRVYGTCDEDSDYDIIVVASAMMAEEERRVDNYNIHIHTPDVFKDHLNDMRMVPLECLFAPQSAKLLEKVDFKAGFRINPNHLKYRVDNQSFHSFKKAKMRVNDGDMYGGCKSLFHSLRMLVFARQILNHGELRDFSAANHYWDEIKALAQEQLASGKVDWSQFKERWFPVKVQLEKEMRGAMPFMDAGPMLIRK